MCNLKVGDKVRLNSNGISQIWGTTVGLSKLKERVYEVTWVDSHSVTDNEPLYPILVDDPEISQFMIDDLCFDKIVWE